MPQNTVNTKAMIPVAAASLNIKTTAASNANLPRNKRDTHLMIRSITYMTRIYSSTSATEKGSRPMIRPTVLMNKGYITEA